MPAKVAKRVAVKRHVRAFASEMLVGLGFDAPGYTPAKGAAAIGAERFIPVTRYAVRDALFRNKGWSGEIERDWRRALHCLAAWRHQDYRERMLQLVELYLPFSSDSDMLDDEDRSPEAKARAQAKFTAGVDALLIRANYTRLSEKDLEGLLNERTPYGLHLDVDLSEFESVLLYYRGSDVETREERNPWKLYLSKNRWQVPIFQRLFLLLKIKSDERRIEEIMREDNLTRDAAVKRLRKWRAHLPKSVSSEHIYLKIFKRIPHIDLEMLFPNTKIGFKAFDKLKLGITAGGGTVAGVMGTATKLIAATNPFTLAGGLIGLCAVIFRQVTKFFNTRNHYMMVLAQNLYFHNLANNRAALTMLSDGAEEEDVKEDMLLYTWLAEKPRGKDELDALRHDVEAFLKSEFKVAVQFDAEDAMRRLIADGVVSEGKDGKLTALTPGAASGHLDRLWDRLLDPDTLDKAAADERAAS